MLAFEQKRASTCTSVHVIIQMLYGVNKHSLLTTSYFLTNQVVSIWINWLSEKIKSFKIYCGFYDQ